MNEIDNKQIKIGAGAIIIKDGMTLLAKRKSKDGVSVGNWGSMGGHVEYGETPMQAAIREAKEELGIDIGNLKFLVCADEQYKGGKQYVDIIFLAEIVSGDPKINDTQVVEEVKWFPLDNLPEPLFAPVKMALETLTSKEHYIEFKE